MKYILIILFFAQNVLAQISGGTVDVNVLGGSVTLSGSSSVTQSGVWNVGLSTGSNVIGSVSNTAFGATQSGVWSVGLSTGSNVIGSISNTGFGITGTLPAFATTPTFNVGTGAFVDRTTAASPYSFRLSDGTAFYDARQIRALTSSDQITIANASVPVTGTFFQSTQPVSIATLPLPTGASTLTEQQAQTTALQLLDNTIGSVVAGTAGTGSLLTGNVFNTNLPTLTNGQQVASQVDSKGRSILPATNGRRSYSATTGVNAAGFAAAGTANTDIFRISGSATATVYVKKIRISATATAVQGNQIAVIKRSTANTGGVAVVNDLVPYDSTSPASGASVVHYTTAPTLGTPVGEIRGAKFLIPTTTTVYNPEVVFEFTENGGNPVTLSGVAQGLSILINSAPGAGNNFLISVEWDEE